MHLDNHFHILVVDDSSPDGTAAIVEGLRNKWPGRLHLLNRDTKDGLGRAYIAGFRWCLDHDYLYIFEMDADMSHNPNDLPRLLEPCAAGRAHMSIGSRYMRGGRVSNWPMGRVLISYFASMYVRIILMINVMDATAGFVCYRREVLENIDLEKIKFVGYAFQIEMKYATVKQGYTLEEVPITFIDRQLGTSKMNMGIFKEAFLGVLKMRFRHKVDYAKRTD